MQATGTDSEWNQMLDLVNKNLHVAIADTFQGIEEALQRINRKQCCVNSCVGLKVCVPLKSARLKPCPSM